MTDTEHKGISQAIVHEFVTKELPLIERTLAEVRAGKPLSAGEIAVLSRNLDKAKEWYSVSWEVPESKNLLAKVIESYEEITSLALENEARNRP